MPGFAQTPRPNEAKPDKTTEAETTLKPVVVRDQREQEGKDAVKVNRSTTARGNQALRDIPQSITVVTEKLIDDRNLDTLKEVLHSTAGVTFLAAEGGEEDIRLRGFSLANTGDIFLDGLRDPAFYERDTFNFDRVDLLRGSASMLFGRGSTGGAANQISKQPHSYPDREVGITLGSYQYRRVTGDLNLPVGQNSAIRLNAMHTTAQNDGRGNGLDKSGVALALRTGIGERHEFSANYFLLENRNPRMNYGLPWVAETQPAVATTPRSVIPGIAPQTYYGLDTDRNASSANILTLGHTWRLDSKTELKTQLRRGLYTRDQRASAVRFASSPTTSLATVGASTLLNRNTNLKIQDLQATQLQSDFTRQLNLAGFKHELLVGADYSAENRQVSVSRTAAQGGIVPIKPPISLGGVVTGGVNSVDESVRVLRPGNDFRARGFGVFVQDVFHLSPHWKLVGGLRYDKMNGNYNAYSLPANAGGPLAVINYKQDISETSERIGVLYQPSDRASFHMSYATSFNTSGDTYSYNVTSANTPPEQSRNFELGAKLDSSDKRWTTRFAAFYAEKFNERNTDVDTAATSLLLSGKRHAAGVEFDIAGKLTAQWEVFGSYMWLPNAKVDKAAACPRAPAQCLQAQPGERVGERPGLIPKHSGTFWTTYQFTPKWRLGAGVNFRSSQKPVLSDIVTPSYQTFDLLAEYRINDQLTVKANVNNVADTYYADVLYRGHYVPGQGRVFTINLTARF